VLDCGLVGEPDSHWGDLPLLGSIAWEEGPWGGASIKCLDCLAVANEVINLV
jgi:hypothetical protein